MMTLNRSARGGLAGSLAVMMTAACLSINSPSVSTEDEKATDPLIPLERLLGPAEYAAPLLNPEGTRISYIAPHAGALNLWVAPVDDLDAARPLTDEPRGVQATDVSGNVIYRWTHDGEYLLYHVDRGGDEKYQLRRVDAQTGERVTLASFEGRKALLRGLSDSDPNLALISLNDGNAFHPHELYLVDIDSGEMELVERTERFVGMMADHDLRPRVALEYTPKGGYAIHRSAGDGEWSPLLEVPSEDTGAISNAAYQRVFGFDAANRYFTMYDSRGRNTAALVRFDLETGEREMIADDGRVDIGGVMTHPTTHEILAYATNWTRKQWHALDPEIQKDFDALAGVADGDFDIVSQSRDNGRWLVRFTLSDAPAAYYLYDREIGGARKLFTSTPTLEGLPLAKMHPVVIRSRDGFDLVSYLMLPRWTDPDGDGRPDEPGAMIVLVHGGPGDERAGYAFAPLLQWLANRGYATLYVNYRGSPGFGKEFFNAARFEWGGKMHDDLIDQVEWAIEEGIADRDRVGILGGSYGGYAVLVGMTMTPDVFACGVDIVGPSSLEKPMPHWTPESMARSVGDPRTEEGRALLKARSPINFAHQTKNPILIGQGANDSRVPQDQSDSMVKIMRESGAQVTYMLFPDEGHGWLRPVNNVASNAIMEVFLARWLGGRHDPIGGKIDESSVLIPEGVEYIEGLAEAIERRDAGGR